MEIEQRDEFTVENRERLNEVANEPQEFQERGVPVELRVQEVDVSDRHDMHMMEQVFEQAENTEHGYGESVLEGLLEQKIIERKD